MVCKSIDLDVDAYDRLEKARLPGESFSSLVRRALSIDPPSTGAELLARLQARGPILSEVELDEIDKAGLADRPPENPWR
jgi:predicted CopG family antitoxin